MITRKLIGLAAVALVLGLATSAWAADAKFTAELIAQRGDELAIGRAVWQTQGRTTTFSVFADHVTSTDRVMVVVNDRYIGEFDIVDGSGMLIISDQQEASQLPQIRPGSKIVLYSVDDLAPVLYGTFRTQ